MTQERIRTVLSGWVMLPVVLIAWVLVPALIVGAALDEAPMLLFLGIVLALINFIVSMGFFALQPNEARVLVLFGQYTGTVRTEGFHWANPFSVKRGGVTTVSNEKHAGQPQQVVSKPNRYRVSLRARNFETQRLKVNDQRGNPIEIAAVIVWSVRDTAQALFDVDDFENYVRVQSETGLRHIANCYPYDHATDAPETETTLRDSKEEVSAALQRELQARLEKVGVEVDDARLTHLAYAPEIASAMLRRQQAEAGADVDADEHDHQPLRSAGQRGEEDHRPGWMHDSRNR